MTKLRLSGENTGKHLAVLSKSSYHTRIQIFGNNKLLLPANSHAVIIFLSEPVVKETRVVGTQTTDHLSFCFSFDRILINLVYRLFSILFLLLFFVYDM